MLAVVAPGQGAQTPGFLAPWLELPGAPAQLRWLSALADLDLVRLGTEAEAYEIRDTAITQPLLVTAGLLAARRLPLEEVGLLAGHSIGEVVAASLAGVLSPESAMTVARLRGRAMADACALAETGMSAVLGGDPDEVLTRLSACDLTPANRNGAGQVVAAGALSGLAQLAEEPPAKARVIALQVAGAFHTPYMSSAEEALEAALGAAPAHDPEHILLSNADGTAVATGAEMMRRLASQVTASVRWDLCQQTMRDLGVTAILELPPAGTLVGLAKRGLKGVQTLALKTPADLPAALDLIERHGGHGGAEPSVSFRVLVAPAGGTFTPGPAAEGDAVRSGATVAQVRTRQGSKDATVGYDGVLVEWLATDGDPVAAGQPLARLQPTPLDHHALDRQRV